LPQQTNFHEFETRWTPVAWLKNVRRYKYKAILLPMVNLQKTQREPLRLKLREIFQ